MHDSSHSFRLAAEVDDAEALLATLSPDVVLHSPVTFRPYVGKESVGAVLRLVSETFDYWRCVEELKVAAGVTGFVFDTRVAGRDLQGVDLLRTGPDGLISDLTVMIRPLSGLIALAEAIGPKVAAAGLNPA